METSYRKVSTPIHNSYLLLNKVVPDERGYFYDVAEVDNPAILTTKHIHAVLATHKFVARGEHYHYRLQEDFYPLSGVLLCILYDMNEDSPSYQQMYAFIGGVRGDFPIQDYKDIPSFFAEDGGLPQLHTPTKVWHAFMPLTDEPATLLALGTHSYDPTDYKQIPAVEISPVYDMLKHYEFISST